MGKAFFKQLCRLRNLNRILEGLHCLVRQGSHLTQDVHHALGHVVLGQKGDVAVSHLDSNRNQNCAFRHLDEVRAHVKREDRAGEQLMLGHEGVQVLELDRGRREDLGGQLDAVKLLRLLLLRRRARAQAFHAALEAVGLRALAHLLIHGRAGAGNVQKRVLLAAVDGEVVVAALASIHKLQIDVLPDALEITVVPRLEGEGGGFAAAFFHRPLVAAAGGMRVNGVGRACRPHSARWRRRCDDSALRGIRSPANPGRGCDAARSSR